MSPPLLQLQDLRIAFHGREVVHGVDLTIQAGEKWALVGESGSGKSVTALSVLRLAQGAQVRGTCLFEGQDVLGMSAPRLQALRGSDIAMIFQEPMTAESAVFHWGTNCRGVDAQRRPGVDIGLGTRGCVVAGDRHSRPCTTSTQLSASTLGRATPARHDCHGPGMSSAPIGNTTIS
mgnify:CR=1 FL=1